MQLGMIGSGRMGADPVRRLTNDGHDCIVFDVSPVAVNKIADDGNLDSASTAKLVSKRSRPRTVRPMVPAGVTGKVGEEGASHMDPGDIIIDGGNSEEAVSTPALSAAHNERFSSRDGSDFPTVLCLRCASNLMVMTRSTNEAMTPDIYAFGKIYSVHSVPTGADSDFFNCLGPSKVIASKLELL